MRADAYEGPDYRGLFCLKVSLRRNENPGIYPQALRFPAFSRDLAQKFHGDSTAKVQ